MEIVYATDHFDREACIIVIVYTVLYSMYRVGKNENGNGVRWCSTVFMRVSK